MNRATLADECIALATFRDPACFSRKNSGRFEKCFSNDGWQIFKKLVESGLFEQLVEDKLVVQSVINYENCRVYQDLVEPLILPHEWTASMVVEAALLVCRLELKLRKCGYTIKDPSPQNIVFDGDKPLWVDVGSFTPWMPRHALWVGYRQFVSTFLGSIVSSSYGIDDALQILFLGDSAGLAPAKLWKLLPFRCRFNARLWLHFGLAHYFDQKKFTGDYDSIRIKKLSTRRRYTVEQGSSLIISLKQLIEQCAKVSPRQSQWSAYYSSNHLTEQELEFKQSIVQKALECSSYTTLIDLGGNNGFLTKIATEHKVKRVVIDGDRQALDQRQEGFPVPQTSRLWWNISRSKVPRGFLETEVDDIAERISGDLVIMFALIHHLIIVESIPASVLVQHPFLANCKKLVLEIPTLNDPMVKYLLSQKIDWHLYDPLEILHIFQENFDSSEGPFSVKPEREIYILCRS
jgi:hypothetical protein